MSKMAIDELEARCDQLQRRMASGSSSSRQTSPARGSTSTTVNHQQSVLNTMAMQSAPSVVSGSTVLPPQPHEIAFAVQQLEQEKKRLEDQLKMVNTHLHTYRYLMKMPSPLPSSAAATAAVSEPHHLSYTSASSALARQPTTNANTTTTTTTNNNATKFISSPARPDRQLNSPAFRAASVAGGNSAAINAATAVSPSTAATSLTFATPSGGDAAAGDRQQGGGSSVAPRSMANDQIADELRRIRRAREEREAQRRLSSAIQAGSSPSKF